MNEVNTKKGSLKSNHYFIYMVIILMFVEILDTYTTTFPTAIPSKVIEEFLLPDYILNVAQSIMAACIAIATIGTYFVFLNQFFADKIGRKKILAFTVFGMGFSSLLLFFSNNMITYTIYLFMLFVFFSSDIWTIYINEEAPQEKRALWTNIILMGGVGGAVLIIIFRSIFVSEAFSYWRGMTFPAIFIGIPLSIIILLTLKETSKFKEMKKTNVEKQQSTSTTIQDMKALFSGT
ncbi:MAG: MFS transporter, partial [archaeon]|nr:MFS transporter [archaeon]